MSNLNNEKVLERLKEEGEELGYKGEVLEKYIWMKFQQLGEQWKKLKLSLGPMAIYQKGL